MGQDQMSYYQFEFLYRPIDVLLGAAGGLMIGEISCNHECIFVFQILRSTYSDSILVFHDCFVHSAAFKLFRFLSINTVN